MSPIITNLAIETEKSTGVKNKTSKENGLDKQISGPIEHHDSEEFVKLVINSFKCALNVALMNQLIQAHSIDYAFDNSGK